ncbi:MAG: hypothetical protein MUE44_29385 [Oscillatoriaceae cyanobacterium Prado104]|nr:hypothetical protein [Oscillatoriaceae cyanobacterium Prado104]
MGNRLSDRNRSRSNKLRLHELRFIPTRAGGFCLYSKDLNRQKLSTIAISTINYQRSTIDYQLWIITNLMQRQQAQVANL